MHKSWEDLIKELSAYTIEPFKSYWMYREFTIPQETFNEMCRISFGGENIESPSRDTDTTPRTKSSTDNKY